MIYKSIIGKRIIHFKTLSSTNTKASELLSDEYLFDGDVLVTDFQDSGKGLDKNTWESERGKNLLISAFVHPNFVKPAEQFILNKVVSLAVCDMVQEQLKRKEVKIKWPNDIYVDDKKIAGILINNSINGNIMQSSIIGIGVNINQTKFHSDAPNPVSLKKLKKQELIVDQCLIRLLDFLNLRFRQLMKNELNDLNQEYLSRLYRYKSFANYIVDGKKINAQIVGLDQYGKLSLKTKDLRTFSCDLKEVTFII